MPGYVMHLAMAERVLAQLKQKQGNLISDKYINEFKIGSIIPDTQKGSGKYLSHFWNDEEFKRFSRTPVLEKFLGKYRNRLKEPFVLGYYAHLYLDYWFMKRYWAKHFSFFDKSMSPVDIFDEVEYVLLHDDGDIYNRQDFFSELYYYGDYDRMNADVIKHYSVALPDVESIRNIIGIDEIDMQGAEPRLIDMIERVKGSYGIVSKEELRVFNFEEMYSLIDTTADEFIKGENT